jgi:hypothetical protein
MPALPIDGPVRVADDRRHGDRQAVIRRKENGMAFDALAELRAAGNPVDQLNAAQLEVMRGLAPAEVATINSIKARVDAASEEVEGHLVVGAGIF